MVPKFQANKIHNESSSPRSSKILEALPSAQRQTAVAPQVFSLCNGSANDDGFLVIGIRPRCIIWTLWLIVLSVDPNAAANFIMDTSELDDGQFWLIPDEWSTLQTMSVMGLILILLLYFYIFFMMVVWRSQRNSMQTKLDSFLLRWRATAKVKVSDTLRSNCFQRAISMTWRAYFEWKSLTGIHGKNRKYWVGTSIVD
ncbi:unnamed protein product [Phytophthora fragariaefolia]|uniref:Unnamed protein product n=1 Tax=Phytophthora fragariaefolia TaxID=1490495 RepID=A0A9W6XT71_9STRA|nr:unnamed protein product [Phytophthora fragariaefolia]